MGGARVEEEAFQNGGANVEEFAYGWRSLENDLRHTHATEMYRQGIDIKIIQQRLGHHSPAFTLETYIHLFHEDVAEQFERLDDHYAKRGGVER